MWTSDFWFPTLLSAECRLLLARRTIALQVDGLYITCISNKRCGSHQVRWVIHLGMWRVQRV